MNAKKEELCYHIDDRNYICLGKRSSEDGKPLQEPFLFINTANNDVCIQINKDEYKNINVMTYDEF